MAMKSEPATTAPSNRDESRVLVASRLDCSPRAEEIKGKKKAASPVKDTRSKANAPGGLEFLV